MEYECKRISYHTSGRSSSAVGFPPYLRRLLATFLAAWCLRFSSWSSSGTSTMILPHCFPGMIAYWFILCSFSAPSSLRTSSLPWFPLFPFWVGPCSRPCPGWWFRGVGSSCCCPFRWPYSSPAPSPGYRFYSFLPCTCWSGFICDFCLDFLGCCIFSRVWISSH